MYKSVMYTLEFTGAKKKKIKSKGPRNMYSLKYLVPQWQKIEDHEDPMLSIKVTFMFTFSFKKHILKCAESEVVCYNPGLTKVSRL